MKKLKQPVSLLIILSVWMVCSPLGALADSQAPAANPPNTASSAPKVENLISAEYGKLLLDDTWHVISAPARWNEKDWILAGLGTGSVVATGIFADKSLKKEIQDHRSNTTDDLRKAFEPFGAEYSFYILGGLEIEGLVFHDDNSRAVAQDGLASSAIAAGIITPSLKVIVGRSRPNKEQGYHHFRPFSSDASFPSGHTTQAFAVASVIADHYDSPLVKIGSYGVASMVGYARMEHNAHWASDVLAGALIGTLVGRTVVHFNKDRRYELSVIADRDKAGLQVTHTF